MSDSTPPFIVSRHNIIEENKNTNELRIQPIRVGSSFAIGSSMESSGSASENRMHDRVHVLTHTASFRNDDHHNHRIGGYALVCHNIDIQIVTGAALDNNINSLCMIDVKKESVVVCIDNQAAIDWATHVGAGKLSLPRLKSLLILCRCDAIIIYYTNYIYIYYCNVSLPLFFYF